MTLGRPTRGRRQFRQATPARRPASRGGGGASRRRQGSGLPVVKPTPQKRELFQPVTGRSREGVGFNNQIRFGDIPTRNLSFSNLLQEQDRRNTLNLKTLDDRTFFQDLRAGAGLEPPLLPNAFVEHGQRQRQQAFGSQIRSLGFAGRSALFSGGNPFQRLSRFVGIRRAQRELR